MPASKGAHTQVASMLCLGLCIILGESVNSGTAHGCARHVLQATCSAASMPHFYRCAHIRDACRQQHSTRAVPGMHSRLCLMYGSCAELPLPGAPCG